MAYVHFIIGQNGQRPGQKVARILFLQSMVLLFSQMPFHSGMFNAQGSGYRPPAYSA